MSLTGEMSQAHSVRRDVMWWGCMAKKAGDVRVAEIASSGSNAGRWRDSRSLKSALLLGSALATSLLILNVGAPTRAHAVPCDQGVPPGPLIDDTGNNMPITCVNVDERVNLLGDTIRISTYNDNNYIELNNSGTLTAGDDGIELYTNGNNADIVVVNTSNIDAGGDGINASTDAYSGPSSIFIGSYGATILSGDNGIEADTRYGDIVVVNTAGIVAGGDGINAETYAFFGRTSDLFISSNGATIFAANDGIEADTKYGDITVINTALITAGEDGIDAETKYGDIAIFNNAAIGALGNGIQAVTGDFRSRGLRGGDIFIANAAPIQAAGFGIIAATVQPGNTVTIVNADLVDGGLAGISTFSQTDTDIYNLSSGVIMSSGGGPAIQAFGASTEIFNAGTVIGFINLTEQGDTFVNQPGGVFQTVGFSNFGGGNDLFVNQAGSFIEASGPLGLLPGEEGAPGPIPNVSGFFNLETFVNAGLISMQDGAEGDLFILANTPGAANVNYIGAGGNLAVDAFLGAPGSQSDVLLIDGNVSGLNGIVVNNTNPGPGSLNEAGILVVRVEGATNGNEFFLVGGPIDTGFFTYDLFFEPTGSGNFELRSFAGAGAFLLPQLISAAQDIWHHTSDTWFDRSADLRTQLWRNGGSVPGVPGAMYLGGGSAKDGVVAEPGGLSPAVWARVTHGELEQDGSARTNAFGRSYSFNLDRELFVADVQSGVDFALKGVMNPADVLLLSVFGGGVSANLQYDQLDRRRFDYDGGQVGAAATYLSGGLFVDALFNAQFLEVEPEALGFSPSFDSDSYGFRVDSGYRFGMGSGGLFLEPLLTLAYVNSDLDGFSFAGNTVSFQAEDSVLGRVGLRAGTSMFIHDVRFEPFVIASYWGELNDEDNRATLVSAGSRPLPFTDQGDDSWGEISLGTNVFKPGNNALSAFSKIDLIFGEDTEGYVARGGFRVQW